MLAGTVMSAVVGGLTGLGLALTQDQGVFNLFFAYQAGGMLAVLAFCSSARLERSL